eukprot:scaffold217_cov341-Pavlova_lutheri.AAC.8
MPRAWYKQPAVSSCTALPAATARQDYPHRSLTNLGYEGLIARREPRWVDSFDLISKAFVFENHVLNKRMWIEILLEFESETSNEHVSLGGNGLLCLLSR